MKKWMITLISLTLALAVAGIFAGFTLTAGSGSPAQDDFGGGKVVTSIDDIDPNVCNLMHNRKPCTPEELGELGIAPTHGDPTYETWLKDNPPTDDMTDTPPLHGDPEPAFDVDGPAILDPAPNTIYDGKGNVSVTNPDVNVDDTPPLHGDPEPPKPVDGTDVPDSPPVIEPLEPGDVGPTENSQDPGVPAGPLAPTDDVEDLPDHVVRTGSTGSGTVLLMDPLLATGAEVKVTGEVISEGIFSVDGRVFEVNGERVLVMDYGDAAALEAEAAGISPSGSSIGSTEDGSVSMVT